MHCNGVPAEGRGGHGAGVGGADAVRQAVRARLPAPGVRYRTQEYLGNRTIFNPSDNLWKFTGANLGLPGVAHVGLLGRVEPGGAAAHRPGLTQPHLALEHAAGLRVQLVHLQRELVLEVAVPRGGRDGLDSGVSYRAHLVRIHYCTLVYKST